MIEMTRRLALVMLLATSVAVAQSSTFTYQGYLTDSGAAAEGVYDFELALYTVDAGGTAVDVNTFDDVTVGGGLFQLAADFTGAPFEAGGSYWVEARVRAGDQVGAHTPLLPRQAINASPYAIAAQAVIAPLDVAGDANVQGTLTVGGDITAAVGEVRAERVQADELFSDGAVDFTGGVVIQRGGDNVALLVENSGPTQPAARVVGDLEVGSLSCGGGTGCVSPDTLASGIYRSRSDLYQVSEEATVPGLLARSIDATCADLNDLPLAGSCPAQGLDLRFFQTLGWSGGGAPAGFRCNYANPISANLTGSASVTCISVP